MMKWTLYQSPQFVDSKRSCRRGRVPYGKFSAFAGRPCSQYVFTWLWTARINALGSDSCPFKLSMLSRNEYPAAFEENPFQSLGFDFCALKKRLLLILCVRWEHTNIQNPLAAFFFLCDQPIGTFMQGAGKKATGKKKCMVRSAFICREVDGFIITLHKLRIKFILETLVKKCD